MRTERGGSLSLEPLTYSTSAYCPSFLCSLVPSLPNLPEWFHLQNSSLEGIQVCWLSFAFPFQSPRLLLGSSHTQAKFKSQQVTAPSEVLVLTLSNENNEHLALTEEPGVNLNMKNVKVPGTKKDVWSMMLSAALLTCAATVLCHL